MPGEETPEGFRVFGYLHNGRSVDYILSLCAGLHEPRP